jgi:hypothetical protein
MKREDGGGMGTTEFHIPVDFTAGKGSMKKESDFNVLFGLSDGLTQEAWKDHEMVILDPD